MNNSNLIILVFLLINFSFIPIVSSIFPFACETVSCLWCNAPRIKFVCSHRCQNCDSGNNKKAIQNKSEFVTFALNTTTPTLPTTKRWNFDPTVPLSAANARFKQCCSKLKDFQPGCVDLCHYDMSIPELQEAVLAGQCDLTHMAQYLFCANDGNDNTDCCDVKGVLAGRPQCTPFCTRDVNIGTLGQSHLVCAGFLPTIMRCHWAGMK